MLEGISVSLKSSGMLWEMMQSLRPLKWFALHGQNMGPRGTPEPHVLPNAETCASTSEIRVESTSGERVSLASPGGFRELCLCSVPTCTPWLSCCTAALSQRLFHSESKRTATHVLSALRCGMRSISARWQAGLGVGPARRHVTHAWCRL